MKKAIFILSAIILMASIFSSCKKEEAIYPQRFRANAEKIANTLPNDQLVTEWKHNDKIRLGFESGTEGVIYAATPDAADASWADFSLVSGASKGCNPSYAVYPASIAMGQAGNQVVLPTEQHSTDGSFAGTPMVTDFSTIDFAKEMPNVKFQNICGLLRIHAQTKASITEIAVMTDQKTNGQYTISYSNGAPVLTPTNDKGTNKTTLTFDSEQDITAGKDFYIYLPAGEYTNVKFRFKNSAGRHCTKTLNAVTVNRNELTPIDLEGNWVFYAPARLKEKAFSHERATQIIFHYNSNVTEGENIKDPKTWAPIYKVMEGTICHVHTPAATIETPVNSERLFDFCSSLTHIDFGDGFCTDKTTSMNSMFLNCDEIIDLDLSSFNTANVTNMVAMFSCCSKLDNPNLSSFNTANVTEMESMFKRCDELTHLDLSSFNTHKVTNMSYMFYGCYKLNDINLSSFNTGNVTNMSGMFGWCINTINLDLSSFNTAKVTDMSKMFSRCEKLTHIDLSSFNTRKVTDMSEMFSNCKQFDSLDLSSFNTAQVTNMSEMFSGCEKLTHLDLSSFNVQNVTNMMSMFLFCRAITQLNLSFLNASSVSDMSYMFRGCIQLTELDLSAFSGECSNTCGIFADCVNMEQVIISSDLSFTNQCEMACLNLGCIRTSCTIYCNEQTETVLRSNGDVPSNVHFERN